MCEGLKTLGMRQNHCRNGMGSSFLGEKLAKRRLQGFVPDSGGFEFEDGEDELDTKSYAEGGEDGSESNWTPEHPAEEYGGTFDDGPADPHGEACFPFKYHH